MFTHVGNAPLESLPLSDTHDRELKQVSQNPLQHLNHFIILLSPQGRKQRLFGFSALSHRGSYISHVNKACTMRGVQHTGVFTVQACPAAVDMWICILITS